MDVDNLFREGLDQVFRNFPKETRQNDKVDMKALQLLDEGLAFEFFSIDHTQGNAQFLRSFNGIGLGIVANHVDDFDVFVIGEIFGNALQVGAVAADEYGQFFHSLSLMVTVSFFSKSNHTK